MQGYLPPSKWPALKFTVPRRGFCSKEPRSQELQPAVTSNIQAHALSQGQSLFSLVTQLILIL